MITIVLRGDYLLTLNEIRKQIKYESRSVKGTSSTYITDTTNADRKIKFCYLTFISP